MIFHYKDKDNGASIAFRESAANNLLIEIAVKVRDDEPLCLFFRLPKHELTKVIDCLK
jgi:hypothetical protein